MAQLTQAQKVRYLAQTLGSIGWKEMIAPALQKIHDGLVNQWLENTDPTKEAQLKAAVKSCRFILGWEARLDELARELDAAPEKYLETMFTKRGPRV